MKLDVDLSGLASLVDAMGATTAEWEIDASPLPPIDRDFGHIEEVEVGGDKTLRYQGRRVILYIKDSRKDRYTLEHDPENGPRYHIAECPTLKRMRIEGRFDRYVMTNRTDGQFRVDALVGFDSETAEIEVPLCVCKKCLITLNYKGSKGSSQSKKLRIWNEFDLAEFLESGNPQINHLPTYTDINAPAAHYSKDWEEVSSEYRRSVNWVCESCGVDLSNHRSLLHTHHRNHVKGDNNRTNLQALCVICHQRVPAHRNMLVRSEDRLTILDLRERQGL